MPKCIHFGTLLEYFLKLYKLSRGSPSPTRRAEAGLGHIPFRPMYTIKGAQTTAVCTPFSLRPRRSRAAAEYGHLEYNQQKQHQHQHIEAKPQNSRGFFWIFQTIADPGNKLLGLRDRRDFFEIFQPPYIEDNAYDTG